MRLVSLPLLSLALSASSAFATSNEQTALGVHTTAEKVVWDWCGEPSDAIIVDDIIISPDPPEPGKNVTLVTVGTVQSRIGDGAYVDVTVKAGPVRLLQKKFDLCEEAEKNNFEITCPVEKGKYVTTTTIELPKQIPRGRFTVDIAGYTADEEDMICLKLIVDFRPKRPWYQVW